MLEVLIIGYGNTLRSDDALGVHAAHALQDFYRDDAKVRALAASQLTWEFAEDVSQARFVIFLDAALGEAPGIITTTAVEPQPPATRITHHCAPCHLLHAAGQLYGDAPQAVTATMAAASFNLGSGLSVRVVENMPRLLEVAKQLVSDWKSDRIVRLGKTSDLLCNSLGQRRES